MREATYHISRRQIHREQVEHNFFGKVPNTLKFPVRGPKPREDGYFFGLQDRKVCVGILKLAQDQAPSRFFDHACQPHV